MTIEDLGPDCEGNCYPCKGCVYDDLGDIKMTIEIIYYTGEKYSIKNATAIDFDGETGELVVQGDNGKVIKYRLVKEVRVV